MGKFSQHKWLSAAIITTMANLQVWRCSLYQPQMTALFLTFLTADKTTPSLSCLGEDLLSVVELLATATPGLQATPVGHTYTLWGMQANSTQVKMPNYYRWSRNFHVAWTPPSLPDSIVLFGGGSVPTHAEILPGRLFNFKSESGPIRLCNFVHE